MADRVFIHHASDDRFRAFEFDGTSEVKHNWLPGFETVNGAAANHTHIYVLDAAPATFVARCFSYAYSNTDIIETRQMTLDITMNSGDVYSGIALTRTHLVAINRTDNKLEYYNLATRAYDSSLDVSLPSQVTGTYFSSICRSGEFLYLAVEDTSAPHRPRIFKRNLDGSAVSDWAGQNDTTALTVFATYDRLNAVRKIGGHWDRWEFDGTQDTTINTAGQGTWQAAYTLFDLATVAMSTPVLLSDGDYQFNITWTDGHDGFAQDDLSLNFGTISDFVPTPNAGQWTVEVTPPSTGGGTIEITIREDAVVEKNKKVTFTVGTFENPTATTSVAISGNGQSAQVGNALANPLVVSIVDQFGNPFQGATVNFAITTGNGATLSAISDTTDADGQAETTLTLGATAGAYTVTATVTGLPSVQFSATATILPVWQTGSALEHNIDALGNARIDIASKVSGATSIKALGGLQEWLSFDGSELVIEDAPILRKDTDFRVKLRATNDDGTQDAFYTVTVNASKLAMLQSALFFKPSITYDGDRVTVHGTSTIVREMTDNDYETYASVADVMINTAGVDGSPTRTDFIFLKTKNVDSYSFTPSGGSGSGFSNRAMPTRFVATSGEHIPTVVNGFQHELYPLPEPVTATSVRLQFHGTDIEIYVVMLLELIAEIQDGDFINPLPYKVDRTGEIIDFPDGGVDRADVIGAERWKWETEYVLKVLPSGTSFNVVPTFLRFIRDNPQVVHAQEPARHPERIYPAEQVSLEISHKYRNKRDYRGGGSIVPFRVAER